MSKNKNVYRAIVCMFFMIIFICNVKYEIKASEAEKVIIYVNSADEFISMANNNNVYSENKVEVRITDDIDFNGQIVPNYIIYSLVGYNKEIGQYTQRELTNFKIQLDNTSGWDALCSYWAWVVNVNSITVKDFVLTLTDEHTEQYHSGCGAIFHSTCQVNNLKIINANLEKDGRTITDHSYYRIVNAYEYSSEENNYSNIDISNVNSDGEVVVLGLATYFPQKISNINIQNLNAINDFNVTNYATDIENCFVDKININITGERYKDYLAPVCIFTDNKIKNCRLSNLTVIGDISSFYGISKYSCCAPLSLTCN